MGDRPYARARGSPFAYDIKVVETGKRTVDIIKALLNKSKNGTPEAVKHDHLGWRHI